MSLPRILVTIPRLLAAILALSAAVDGIPAPHSRSRRGHSSEAKLDKRLATSPHPLLSFVPVPRTAEERSAAKKPDYINWMAERSKGRRSLTPRFDSAEHAYLGDCLVLQGPNGDLPTLYNFSLPNGLALTYGQINFLAGDFYGTYDPISDGMNLTTQIQNFMAAYNLLATDTSRQPSEAQDIISAEQPERDAFAAAVANGTDPSVAYSQLPDTTADFEEITITRPLSEPGYLGLAAINFDHFGDDARTAYNAGHAAAIQVALGRTPQNLLTAYTLNAFADHFLEDSFAAGHMRTPRRVLHDTADVGGPGDICAKFMHDEDNAIGLAVTNPLGASWTAYGDGRLMDAVDQDNVNHALNALRISAGEIYTAWSTGVAPSTYGAWNEAPTLESARGPQALAPLFTQDGQRRSDIEDRRTWDFTDFYTYVGTAAECELSGMWDYPITMT